jgi:hypothetical protein
LEESHLSIHCTLKSTDEALRALGGYFVFNALAGAPTSGAVLAGGDYIDEDGHAHFSVSPPGSSDAEGAPAREPIKKVSDPELPRWAKTVTAWAGLIVFLAGTVKTSAEAVKEAI